MDLWLATPKISAVLDMISKLYFILGSFRLRVLGYLVSYEHRLVGPNST